jgi:hypothetical protein
MHAATQTPLQIVHAAERHILSQTRLAISSLQDAVAVQMPNVAQLIRTATNLTQDDVTSLLEHLVVDNGTFNGDDRKEIGRLAQSRLQSVLAAGGASDKKDQAHKYLYLYYPDWLWQIVRSTESMHNKLNHTADFWISQLGLRDPDENTKRLGVAILHEASGVPIDPQLGYDHLHDLAAAVVRKRSVIPSLRTLPVFPKDVNEFMQQYPSAYTNEHPPAPCRLEYYKILERCNKTCIPARSSNHRVNGKSPKLANIRGRPSEMQMVPASPTTNTLNVADCMKMMMEFMTGKTTAPPVIDGGYRGNTPPARAATFNGDERIDGRTDAVESGQPATHTDKPASAGTLPGCLKPPDQNKAAAGLAAMSKLHEAVDASMEVGRGGGKGKKGGRGRGRRMAKAEAKRADSGESSDSERDPDLPRPMKAMKEMKVMKAMKGKKPKKLPWNEDPAVKKLLAEKQKGKAKRPTFSSKPVTYRGGKIYFSKAKQSLRVYLRSPTDKVEKLVSIIDDTKKGKDAAMTYACVLIEKDPRPAVA